MKFTWVTINVRNMEESLDFYTKRAGLTVNRRYSPMEGTEIAFLGSEETATEVELICNRMNREPGYGRDISLGFAHPSLESMIEDLKKEGIPFQGPFSPIPSVSFLYVDDPNGVKVQFLQDRD